MAQTNDFNIIETPCFILDEKEFRLSVNGFQQALKSCFTNYTVGYSVKTNSLPYVMSVHLNKDVMRKLFHMMNINWQKLLAFLLTILFIMVQ